MLYCSDLEDQDGSEYQYDVHILEHELMHYEIQGRSCAVVGIYLNLVVVMAVVAGIYVNLVGGICVNLVGGICVNLVAVVVFLLLVDIVVVLLVLVTLKDHFVVNQSCNSLSAGETSPCINCGAKFRWLSSNVLSLGGMDGWMMVVVVDGGGGPSLGGIPPLLGRSPMAN